MGKTKLFDKIPKYKRLADILQKEITGSNFLPGQQFLTEFEIQKKYNVSRSVIREAMQNLVHRELVTRVAGKGTFVNNFSNTNGSSNKFISINIPWLSNPGIEFESFSGIESVVFKRGYKTVVTNINNCLDNMDEIFQRIIKDDDLQNVLFQPIPGEFLFKKNIEFMKQIREKNKNIVVLDTLPAIDIVPDFDYVITDNFNGGYLIAKHLIKLGHKRIAFIGGRAVYSGQQRVNGYKKALEENNIVFDENLVKRFEGRDISFVVEKVKQFFSMNKPPTAIFAECDFIARDVLAVLQNMGLNVPEDISLVGYDDLNFAKSLNVPLTTIKQPFYEEGRLAAEILIDKLEGKTKEIKQIILPIELVLRQSTSKPKIVS
jgi:GntR family transcriptional regulator, arabinose operon transcriptional repressor